MLRESTQILLATLLLLCGLPAPAQPAKSMTFTHFVVCPRSREPPCGSEAILARGTIVPDSPATFEAFLRRANITPSASKWKRFVVFDSPGGSLIAGMQIGRIIRRYQLSTLQMKEVDGYTLDGPQVDLKVTDASCVSACSLAFLGGVQRVATSFDGRIGIHQFASASDTQLGDSTTQVAMTVLAKYVDEMGVNRAFLDIASLTPPSSVHWLTADQQQRLLVDNNFLQSAGWELVALPDDTPAAQFLFVGSGTLQFFKRGGRRILRVEFHVSDASRAIQTFSKEPIYVGVNNGPELFETSGSAWRRTKSGTVDAQIEFPASALPAILQAETLYVRVGGTSMATLGLAPEGDFPMKGAAPKIRAALK